LFVLTSNHFIQVALLASCVRRNLKVLSAMGAGARADPTRIRIADLRESTNDPLSRAVFYLTAVIYLIFQPTLIYLHVFKSLSCPVVG
jgi:hypothetical protein